MLEKYQDRIQIAAIVGLAECLSPFLLSFASRDVFYFVACGAVNIVTLAALMFQNKSLLSIDIFKLTAAQFVIQFIGCALLILRFHPVLYNDLIHFIVFITYIRLVITRNGDYDAQKNTSGLLVHFWLARCKTCLPRASKW